MFQPNAINSKATTDSSLIRSGRPCVLLLIVLLSVVRADAQTGGAAPPNNAPGRPAGSYQLSGFDNVNLFNGNLNFSLPLLQVGGRGSTQIPVTLNIDSTRWKLGRDGGLLNESARLNIDPDVNPIVNYIEFTDGVTRWLCRCSDESVEYFSARYQITHHVRFDRTGDGLTDSGGTLTEARYYRLDPNGWQGIKAGYGPGILQGRIAFRRSGRHNQITSRLTRIVFTTPDGTELELRDRATYGRPFLTGQTNPPRGRVFVSADGKATTFIADAAVADDPAEMDAAPAGDLEENLWLFAPDGFLLFADGTRYRVDDGLILWIRDRNGNLTTFEYDSGGRVKRITDPLNRAVTFSYYDRPDPADPAKSVRDYDLISFSGFRGQPRSILVRHKKLSEGGVLRADFPAGDSFRTRGSLFPQYEQGPDANLVFDTDVVTAVELPNGRSYELLYNHHGEVARVTLPTGAAIEYDFHSAANSLSTQRAVWRRRVYEGGGGITRSGDVGAPTLTQTYKAVLTGNVTNQPYRTAVTAEQWQGPDGAGGTLLTRDRHYFRGWADTVQAGFYPPAMEGREEKAETLDTTGDAATAAVLRRVTYDWRQRPAAPDSPEGWNNNIPRDLRMVEAVTTLENGVSSKTTSVYPGSSTGEVGFDRYNNQTDLWEYDYKAEGEAWRLLRHTRTKYIQSTAVGGTTYDYACDPATTCAQPTNSDGLIHLRRLPEYTEVTDGVTGTVVSRSEFLYDEPTYSSDEYGNLPADFPGWAPAVTAARGNPTTVRAWLNTLGAHADPQAYLQTHVRYDRFGNVTGAWDALGNASGVEFSADYKYAFPTRTTSADPDGDGSLSPLVTTTAYDLSSGLTTATIDANNQTTFFDYEAEPSKLDRLKKVRHPDGGWTSYEYGDQPAGLFLRTKRLREAGTPEKVLENYQFFDGLGRVTRSTSRTGEATWAARATKYDALGRVVGATNPYEISEHTELTPQIALWTKTKYDALGRAWEVETPDGAKAITHFDGNRTLVTDQSGKQRLSKMDALGHLAEVWEVRSPDPATGTEAVTFPHHDDIPDVAAGYRTVYAYDALGNLRKIKQGEQRRYFAYDSLSRLLRAKNPEQTLPNAVLNDFRLPAGLVSPLSDDNNSWSLKYEYDENGNVNKRVDARRVETSYAYDALNRLTGRTYTDVKLPQGGTLSTPPVKYYYDNQTLPPGSPVFMRGKSLGRLVAVIYGGPASVTGNYTGEYDAMGRAHYSAQVTVMPDASGLPVPQPPYIFRYEYNPDGSLKRETYPTGRVIESEYDTAGRVAGVRNQGGDYYAGGDPAVPDNQNVIAYTAHGAVAALRLGNGLWEHTAYNQRLQPETIGLGTSRIDSSKLKLEYGYGSPTAAGATDPTRNNGNVRTQKISVPAAGQMPAQTLTQTYTYDALNRVSAAAEVNASVPTWEQSYTYDRYGNRRLDAAQTTTPKLTEPGQTAMPTVANPSLQPLTNRITEDQDGDGLKEYTYDEAGNLTCDTHHCAPTPDPTPYYGYDGENKLVSAGGSEYLYDGDGRRVKKVVRAVTTVFVYDGAGRLMAEYSNEQRPAQSSYTSYVTQDALGSTRLVTGPQQEVKGRYDYLPFGEEITEGRVGYGGGSVRQKFTGYERDADTILDYAQARHYASAQGRFTTVDPLMASAQVANPQTFNRYIYVANNPLNLTDPTGMCPTCQDGGDEGEPVRTDINRLHTSWIVRMSQRWYDYVNGLLADGWSPGHIEAMFGVDLMAHPPTATAISSGNETAQKVEPYIQNTPVLGAWYNTLMAGRYANLGQGSQSDVLFNTALIPFEYSGLAGGTAKQGTKLLDARLAGVIKRHGGEIVEDAVDSIRFSSRKTARQAASEMAGDLGSSPRAIRASEFRGGPSWMSNSNRVIGRESLDGTRMWRDDFLGHPQFNMRPHVNVSINGRNFHFFY